MSVPKALVNTLVRGGIAVIPTDSCYGIATNALNRKAVSRLLKIKGRASVRPPAIFVPDIPSAMRLAPIDSRTEASLHGLLPGPLTILLSSGPQSPPWLVGKEGLIGIRCISFAPVQYLLRATGLLLTATSANTTGLPPPYTLAELERVFPVEAVDFVLRLPCGGLPLSTVLDMSQGTVKVVREGALSKKEAFEALHVEESCE